MSAILPAIRSALQPAIRAAISGGYGSSSAWSPLTLFAASEVGVWYDPSDFSTMFQDSAGTTPVTAVGHPVGLVLDKSKGLALGVEIFPEGTFDTDVSGSWTPRSANTSLSVVSERLRIGNNGATFQYGARSFSTVAGKSYKITFDFVKPTAANLRIRVGSAAGGAGSLEGAEVTSAGSLTYIVAATTTTTWLTVYCQSGTTTGVYIDVDNISVKELAGNHALQATSLSRLTSATGNSVDLDGADDSCGIETTGGSTTGFMLVAAIKPEGGAGAVRTIWSDTGTNTGYSVRINASNQLEMIVGNGSAYTTVATSATLDVGTAYVVSAWDDGTDLNVQINSGTVASATRPTVSAGTSTATIGKSNGAGTNYFNGLIYQIIQTNNDGGTVAERAAAASYCATKGGVTL